jgi:hypothetical protein
MRPPVGSGLKPAYSDSRTGQDRNGGRWLWDLTIYSTGAANSKLHFHEYYQKERLGTYSHASYRFAELFFDLDSRPWPINIAPADSLESQSETTNR